MIAYADYTYADDWLFYVDPTYDSSETYDDEDAAWIHVTSDDGKGNVTFSVDETTAARKAFVFAFPRAFYDELNEAHNGNGLNWIPDDDGDIQSEYEQYVIFEVEQTTKTGDEKFGVQDGNTLEGVEVETECPEGYDVSSVLEQYTDAYVGYIPWQVEYDYEVTVFPLSVNGDWICDPAAYDANGDSCYGQSYYSIESNQTYYAGNANYYGVNVYINETPPVNYFYLVFINPDTEETWVLFFYGQGESGSEEAGILVQYVDENGVIQEVSVETEAPSIEAFDRYSYTFDDFLGDDMYPTSVVGYIPFKKGVTYITTLKPLSTESTWISDNFFVRDCHDEALYGNYTDPSDAEEYEGIGFKTGSANNTGYTASDGVKYPSADIQCISMPANLTNLYVVGYRQSSSFNVDSYDAILFIYSTGDDDSGDEETSPIFAVNGTTYDDLGVIETTYTGEIYDEFISGVKSDYNVAGEAYIHYEVDKDYTVGVATATSSDDWAQEPTALDYYGNYVYQQSSVYDFEAGQTAYYNGAMRPATNLSLYSDPGCIFYFVWTDDSGNSYILFFYNDEMPSDEGGETDELGDFILTSGSATVLTSIDSYTGKYDLQAIVDHYDAQKVGLLNATVNSTYNIAFSCYNNQISYSWITDNVKAFNYEGTEYERNDDRPSGTLPFFTTNKTQGFVQFGFATDPGTLVYLLFTDDDGNNYVFFLIYSEPSTDPGEPVFPGDDNGEEIEYGLEAKESSDTGVSWTDVTIETDCPDGLNVSNLVGDCTNVGYVAYKSGVQVKATVTPLGSVKYVDVRDSFGDDVHYTSEDDFCDYETGLYDNNEDHLAVFVFCDNDLDSSTDYVYATFTSDEDGEEAIGYLFFYKTEDSDSGEGEETEWVAVPSSETTEWGESVWSGLSAEYGATDAVTDDFVYSDGYLYFFNNGGSGFKFASTSGTYHVQLAGTGSTSKCCIQFKVTTAGTVKVTATSGNASTARYLKIAVGSDVVDEDYEVPGYNESAAEVSYYVSGITDETTISLYSKSSTINIIDIQWVPGEDESGEGGGGEETPEGDPLVLEYTLDEAGTITLPIAGTVDATVDWGDGSDYESVTTANPTHTYSAAGSYTVKVYGSVTNLKSSTFATASNPDLTLTAVTSWGSLGLTDLQYAFQYCEALTTIPSSGAGLEDVTTFNYAFNNCTALNLGGSYDEPFDVCTKATNFSYAFQNCTSLNPIPSNLFSNCTAASNFGHVFYGCTALTSIPTALFAKNTAATDFSYAFSKCTKLNAASEGIFKNNTAVTTFAYLFADCSSLSMVENIFNAENYPELTTATYIFENCTAITSATPSFAASGVGFFDAFTEADALSGVFMGCTALKTVPVNIFDNCKKISKVVSAFNGCSNWSGESPYTEIEVDGETVKVHLYERADYTDYGFTAINTGTTTSRYCFKDCTGLSDYDEIPATNWK
ncbi:MAG: BspA family leucine-rich repeat surface protein [Porphyromonadaceae bacterium]|nr:BspA family leucine-rich repeat surface protein [Porphyromonadaceae bacterium]